MMWRCACGSGSMARQSAASSTVGIELEKESFSLQPAAVNRDQLVHKCGSSWRKTACPGGVAGQGSVKEGAAGSCQTWLVLC